MKLFLTSLLKKNKTPCLYPQVLCLCLTHWLICLFNEFIGHVLYVTAFHVCLCLCGLLQFVCACRHVCACVCVSVCVFVCLCVCSCVSSGARVCTWAHEMQKHLRIINTPLAADERVPACSTLTFRGPVSLKFKHTYTCLQSPHLQSFSV